MTDVKQFFTGAAADLIPRDRWGRPMILPADGGKPVPYTRCTTYVSVLEDMSNLALWKQRQTALGLVARPALRMAVAAAKDDKAKLNAIMKQCMDAAGSGDAADLGTAIHRFTENYDNGLDISDMPPDFRPDLDAYIKATSGMEMLAVEQFLVVDELQVAGTTDRIVRLNGQNFIADVKTGGIEYGAGKIAMQLAVYAHGAAYDHVTGERRLIPPVSQKAGIVIHLPAGTGTCKLYWVNLVAGWEAARDLAGKVREWRKRKDFLIPIETPAEDAGQGVLLAPEPPAQPEPTPAAPLAQVLAETHAAAAAAGAAVADRNIPGTQAGWTKYAGEIESAIGNAIEQAATNEELTLIWELNKTVWSDRLTEAARARKQQLGA